MKTLIAGSILISLAMPVAARAVLLDCEIDAQRVYTCIELGESAVSSDRGSGDTEAHG